MINIYAIISTMINANTQAISHITSTSTPPISISIANSPDYITIGLAAASTILTLLTVIIAFRSFRTNRELSQASLKESRRQSEASLEESRRQSEAALMISQQSIGVTLKTVQEMREARDQESAPYVIAYFDLDLPMIFFVVKNLGKSVATDIKLSIDPPLVTKNPSINLNDLSMIKNGIATLAPGSEIRTFFDSTIGSFSDPNWPLKYKVTIAYKGGLLPDLRWHEMTLDLSAYKGLYYDSKKDLDDLVKEIEQIRKAFEEFNPINKKIAETLKDGLWIKNPEILSLNLNLESADVACLSFISARLQEFKSKWQSVYRRTIYRAYNAQGEEMVNPHDSNTKHECTLFGQQILFTLSRCQASLPEELTKKIFHVATTLFTLGRMEIHGSGNNSEESFNETGNDTLQEIEDISKLIEEYNSLLVNLAQKQNIASENAVTTQNGHNP